MTVLRLLAGRTALVTGSSSGIGLQIAQALAASGANVLLHGLMEPAAADALVTKISANYSVKVAVSTHDLSRGEAEVGKMISACESQLGPVDILVNNAGIQVWIVWYAASLAPSRPLTSYLQHVSPIEDFAKELYDKIIAVNLTAPWLASKAVVSEMRRRRYGRIVNVASVHGLVVGGNRMGRYDVLVNALPRAGQCEQVRLRREQARRRGPYEGPRARDRGFRRHGQCNLPRLGAHPARASPDRCAGGGEWEDRRGGGAPARRRKAAER